MSEISLNKSIGTDYENYIIECEREKLEFFDGVGLALRKNSAINCFFFVYSNLVESDIAC